MKSSPRATALRKLLDLCDDLHRLRDRMTDPSLRRDTRARLRRQSKRKADQLALNLAAYRFRGPLGQVMRENRFTVQDFELLASLLQATMHAEDPAVEGRLLLGSLFRTSFEVLSGMDLLHESSRLRASGLVILADDEEEPADLLEARFRLSEDALDSFRQEISGLVPEDTPPITCTAARVSRNTRNFAPILMRCWLKTGSSKAISMSWDARPKR